MEKQKLITELTNTSFRLFEEPTMSPDKWWFITAHQIELPMLELIPIEHTNDPWIDLWLPHIQIDIDTHIKAEIIEKRAIEIFRGNPAPFHSVIVDSTIHVVRLRVGIVAGVNIVIDLGTNKRHNTYRYKYLFKHLT